MNKLLVEESKEPGQKFLMTKLDSKLNESQTIVNPLDEKNNLFFNKLEKYKIKKKEGIDKLVKKNAEIETYSFKPIINTNNNSKRTVEDLYVKYFIIK